MVRLWGYTSVATAGAIEPEIVKLLAQPPPEGSVPDALPRPSGEL
jgi:hypothetical protein